MGRDRRRHKGGEREGEIQNGSEIIKVAQRGKQRGKDRGKNIGKRQTER
jgi:hypothetical protein